MASSLKISKNKLWISFSLFLVKLFFFLNKVGFNIIKSFKVRTNILILNIYFFFSIIIFFLFSQKKSIKYWMLKKSVE